MVAEELASNGQILFSTPKDNLENTMDRYLATENLTFELKSFFPTRMHKSEDKKQGESLKQRAALSKSHNRCR
jgi:hypothetical protein